MLGHLKKYPRQEHITHTFPFEDNFPSSKVTPNPNYEHDYFYEWLDPQFPCSLFKELYSTTFVDNNHKSDIVTGKVASRLLRFVANAPADRGTPTQVSTQTVACGVKLHDLKLAFERVVTIKCHLRSIKVLVTKASTM